MFVYLCSCNFVAIYVMPCLLLLVLTAHCIPSFNCSICKEVQKKSYFCWIGAASRNVVVLGGACLKVKDIPGSYGQPTAYCWGKICCCLEFPNMEKNDLDSKVKVYLFWQPFFITYLDRAKSQKKTLYFYTLWRFLDRVEAPPETTTFLTLPLLCLYEFILFRYLVHGGWHFKVLKFSIVVHSLFLNLRPDFKR